MRTAICITGQSRTFGTHIAKSIHDNILSVLAYDGFDVFLVLPGPIRYENETLIEQWRGNVSLLEPFSFNHKGVPNRLFKIVQDEQHNLPFNLNDRRWTNNFLTRRTTNTLHKYMYIQNLLYMAHDQFLCHNITKSRNYTAKIRMRPDMVFKTKLSRSTPISGKIIATAKDASTEDQFAFGTDSDMNVYLSRFPMYYNTSDYYKGKQWTTESFLKLCLAKHNISIWQDPHFHARLLRSKGFTRLIPCTSELAKMAHPRS